MQSEYKEQICGVVAVLCFSNLHLKELRAQSFSKCSSTHEFYWGSLKP